MRALLYLFLLTGAFAQQTTTHIVDVLYGSDGQPIQGSMQIVLRGFTAPGGVMIVAEDRSLPIVNGVIDIRLVPTQNSVPVTYYQITIRNRTAVSAMNWDIPASSIPLKVKDILRVPIGTPGLIQPPAIITQITSTCSSGAPIMIDVQFSAAGVIEIIPAIAGSTMNLCALYLTSTAQTDLTIESGGAPNCSISDVIWAKFRTIASVSLARDWNPVRFPNGKAFCLGSSKPTQISGFALISQ